MMLHLIGNGAAYSLPPHFYRLVDLKAVLPHPAVIGHHMDAPQMNLAQQPRKPLMRLPVRHKTDA